MEFHAEVALSLTLSAASVTPAAALLTVSFAESIASCTVDFSLSSGSNVRKDVENAFDCEKTEEDEMGAEILRDARATEAEDAEATALRAVRRR